MREAIDSALTQTYDKIEVIVINDGSTDDTEEIAKSYGDKIRYFAKENGGVSTALNMGISNMRGEYFSWLSHDDIYYPSKIEACIEAIKDCPNRIVYSDYDVIDDNGKVIDTANFRKYYRYADFEYGLFVILNGAANGCTMLIPRENFDMYGMFDETLRTTQDYDLFFKMFRTQRLVYINEPLTKYRSHESQQTHINPLTIAEGNALWVTIFERLTEEEILTLGGSLRMFWYEKSNMLKGVAFHGAAKFAQDKYEACVTELRNAKISIIMPFYNRLDLMIETIESVISQTYKNWELILANDGTDDDISIIQAIANQDKRIKLINLSHKGVSAARNSAIAASSGEFIAFLDSDDLWQPTKLEKHLEYMLDNGYAFAYTSFEQRFLNGDFLACYDVSEFCGDVFFQSITDWRICICTVMFERTTMRDAVFPEHISMGEDICLWFHFLWRYEAGAVSDVLTTIRVSSTSASQNIHKGRKALYSVLGFLLENYYYEECMNYIGMLSYGLSTLFPKVSDEFHQPNSNSLIEDLGLSDSIPPVNNLNLLIPEESIATLSPDMHSESINPRNYLLRFIRALNKYGPINFWKVLAKKLLRPIYHRVYNRFVGIILDELQLSRMQLFGMIQSNNTYFKSELQLTKEQLANELQLAIVQLSDELQLCNDQVSSELESSKAQILSAFISSITQLSGQAESNMALLLEELDSNKMRLSSELYTNITQLSDQLKLNEAQFLERFDKHEFEMKLLQEVVTVNTAAFSEYKNVYTGKDIVVMGAGPTLSKYSPIEGAIHIGVNRVFMHEGIDLDFLFFVDDANMSKLPNYNQIIKGFEELVCKKFFALDAATYYGEYEPSESFCVRANATRFFVEDSTSRPLYPDIRVRPTMLFRSVIFPAIHFALFTNPKRVYLAGCDMSLDGYFTGDKQTWLHDIETLRVEMKMNLIGYRRLKEFAQRWYPETEIISINPVNLKGLFSDVFTNENGNRLGGEETRAIEDICDFSDQAIEDFVNKYVDKMLNK